MSVIKIVQPSQTLLYRGIVNNFHQKKGFGFIEIKALIRNIEDVSFDYLFLQPIGHLAMIHYKDILTDTNVERFENDMMFLRPGQHVYFNLTLNASQKFQAMNLVSETIVASGNEVTISYDLSGRGDKD